jgi:hypothetical protein
VRARPGEAAFGEQRVDTTPCHAATVPRAFLFSEIPLV